VSSVPPLSVKPPGRGLRALGLVVPGVRRVNAQIGPYTEWWSEQNQEALVADGPLWICLGDSTVLGIGASAPDHGWVGQMRDALGERNGTRWRIVNLAMSGARLSDVIETQLPILEDLTAAGHRPDLVTCSVGTNDVLWSRSSAVALRAEIDELTRRLPQGALVATLAGGSQRVVLANRAMKQAVRDRGLVLVQPWRADGPGLRERVADDRFHPSDLGHELIARQFLGALDEQG
jgi:lysophospholipase L1-like esterase